MNLLSSCQCRNNLIPEDGANIFPRRMRYILRHPEHLTLCINQLHTKIHRNYNKIFRSYRAVNTNLGHETGQLMLPMEIIVFCSEK